MLQALCVLTALTVGADDGDLPRALGTVQGADSYTFTVEENNGGAVEGRFQKDRPVAFTADRIEFFKKGDALVYKQGDAWQKSKTGTESDPLRVLAASAKVRGARPPHEELAGFLKHLNDVKASVEKGLTVYSADLTADGAKALANSADRDVARGGTAKLWVDDKDRVVRYEIAIKLKGKRGNAEVDGEATRKVSIKEVGATKVEVPAEVKKLFE